MATYDVSSGGSGAPTAPTPPPPAPVDQYSPSWVAEYFHSYPHLDFMFRKVSKTFSMNEEYIQSLIFWAVVPGLLLLVLLITLFVYYCYQCCSSPPLRRRSPKGFTWGIAAAAFLGWVCVALGLYGSQLAHYGFGEAVSSVKDISSATGRMQTQVKYVLHVCEIELPQSAQKLGELGKKYAGDNGTVAEEVEALQEKLDDGAREARVLVGHVGRDLFPTSEKANKKAKKSEFWRYLATFLSYAFLLIVTIVLVVGSCHRSKCTLVVGSALGILGLIIIFGSTGVHHGFCVGMGDFCVDPNDYVESSYHDYFGKNVSSEVLDYYLKCDSSKNPYEENLLGASTKLNEWSTNLKDINELLVPITPPNELKPVIDEAEEDLGQGQTGVQQLVAEVDCRAVHNKYTSGVEAICDDGLSGLALNLLMSLLFGLFLFAMLIIAACSWLHFRKSRGYNEIDENDPFVPRHSENGYHSGRNSRHEGVAETVPLQDNGRDSGVRSSPPPEYHVSHGFPRAPTAPAEF